MNNVEIGKGGGKETKFSSSLVQIQKKNKN